MICKKNNNGLLLGNGVLLLLSVYITNANPTPKFVFSNSRECSNIGAGLLNKGGSAVDAAIATILCDSLVSLQGLAIGGGFIMKLWDSKTKTGSILTAKEQPPAAKKRSDAKAVEVPGDIAGFWEVHQKYGKLPWTSLFDDSLLIVDKNAPTGDKTTTLNLIDTLKKISVNGKDIFYKGEIAEKLVKEIQAAGGITTLDDFKNYQPQWVNNIAVPSKINFHEKADLSVPHASVVGPDGFCVTVTSTNNRIPDAVFKSNSTGIILKEC